MAAPNTISFECRKGHYLKWRPVQVDNNILIEGPCDGGRVKKCGNCPHLRVWVKEASP